MSLAEVAARWPTAALVRSQCLMGAVFISMYALARSPDSYLSLLPFDIVRWVISPRVTDRTGWLWRWCVLGVKLLLNLIFVLYIFIIVFVFKFVFVFCFCVCRGRCLTSASWPSTPLLVEKKDMPKEIITNDVHLLLLCLRLFLLARQRSHQVDDDARDVVCALGIQGLEGRGEGELHVESMLQTTDGNNGMVVIIVIIQIIRILRWW